MQFQRPIASLFTVALTIGAALPASASQQPSQADLRSMLKQPAPPPPGSYPRQLSAEERAVLRQQLAQPVVVPVKARRP
ncbi:MAG: hypothetical protein HY854_11305 [Burkholderiales bacterium]|nr:hypothetical protein [Burkholderiales bacterium]